MIDEEEYQEIARRQQEFIDEHWKNIRNAYMQSSFEELLDQVIRLEKQLEDTQEKLQEAYYAAMGDDL